MTRSRPSALHQRGLTLVELLVAMAISLIVTLAVT
ncbi:MAG: prepilin-type N-terminal cleavage/methylation domain-containing protein, partial [Alcaligenaceae bacterium]